MVKPPVVQLAGMLRALGRGIDTDAWIWLCEPPVRSSSARPNVSGWDDARWLDTSRMRARWNLVDYALDEVSVDAWDDSYSTTETADEALDAGARLLGLAAAALRAPRGAARLRPAAENPILANWQQGPYRAMRQNALLQLIGVSPDTICLSDPMSHNCCNDYTRSQLLRSAAAEAGQGLPAIEPGMPVPAGTGLSRRTFLSRPPGWRSPSTAPRRSRSRPSRRESPRRRRPTKSWSRSSSTAASTRSACWRRSATRATRSCGPTSRSPRKRARAFSRGPAPALAPGRRRPRDPARRGQGQRLPGDRLRPAPTSRTSPRATSTRSASSRSATAPAGSAATSTSSATTRTRCRASRWTARSRR